jgi:hypothetical protein
LQQAICLCVTIGAIYTQKQQYTLINVSDDLLRNFDLSTRNSLNQSYHDQYMPLA